MFCSKCGHKNDDAAPFCTGCGVALQESRTVAKNKKPSQGNQTKSGPRVLIILGIALTALMLLAIVIFCLGAGIFSVLGESRYFAGYVMLKGYYPSVNFLFLLDYLMMAIGSIGVPILIAGCIWRAVDKKK